VIINRGGDCARQEIVERSADDQRPFSTSRRVRFSLRANAMRKFMSAS